MLTETTILLDQDDVLADFENYFIQRWKELYPDEPVVPFEKRTHYDLEHDYPEYLHEKIREVWLQKGFFLNLPPIPGAIDATNKMVSLGHKVFICSAPLRSFEHCVYEKYEWIDKYLGPDFVRRMILTCDKTLIKGRFLIDNKPVIDGIAIPEWEHVIFDAPYNRKQRNKRRMNWKNWREVLGI